MIIPEDNNDFVPPRVCNPKAFRAPELRRSAARPNVNRAQRVLGPPHANRPHKEELGFTLGSIANAEDERRRDVAPTDGIVENWPRPIAANRKIFCPFSAKVY